MQRPHQKLINKWASNSDSLVYCHDKVGCVPRGVWSDYRGCLVLGRHLRCD